MRLIIMDAHSGYICGDTARIPRQCLNAAGFDSSGSDDETNILAACEALDFWLYRDCDSIFEYVSSRNPQVLNGADGYVVYRADVGGSEAVAVVQDGQEKDTIEDLIRHWPIVGVVARR